MIRHTSSGKIAFAHFSDETALNQAFAKIFDEFNYELESSKQFEIRLIGGIKGEEKSEILFKFILAHLLAKISERGCCFNFLSTNCFDTLLAYRDFNVEKNEDVTVGCLFDRTGKPILFSIPEFGQIVPYTNRGDAMFLCGPSKQKAIWFFAQRTLESADEDLLKIFDDTKQGYNEELAIKIEQCFRRQLIISIMTKIADKSLVLDPKNPFIFNVLDQHIDEWRKNYCRIFSIEEGKASYSSQLIDYITWQKYTTVYRNLSMPFSRIHIDQLFINVLLKDDCLKILLLETAYQFCTSFICTELPFMKEEDLIRILQESVVSPWHLLTELARYQNSYYRLIRTEPRNLIALLLQYPNQMVEQITEWQKAKLKVEIGAAILNPILAQLPQRVIDQGPIDIIRQRLEQEGVRLLPFLHGMSSSNPSLDQLISNLVHILESTNKWTQCFSVNVNAEVMHVLNKWLETVRLTDPKPLLSLKESDIIPPSSDGCRLM